LPLATGLSFIERMQAAAQFTPEEAEALAPCEARKLFDETGYENLSEEVEIHLASGVVARGQAAGQSDGWVQVIPGRDPGDWPEQGRKALNIAAPIAVAFWPSRMNTVQDNNNQEGSND
jgi:hypothetical protein